MGGATRYGDRLAGSCERRLAVDHHLQDAGVHRNVLVRFRMDMRDRIASAAAARIQKHLKRRGGQTLPRVVEDEGLLVEARRIDALETALGLKLFDRRQSGYALTEMGKELAEAAAAVEVAAGALASKAAALRRGLTGTVRITTNDLFAGKVPLPSLSAFRQMHPGILLRW